MGVFISTPALAFNVSLTGQGNKKDGSTTSVPTFQWLVEEDNIHPVTPGVSDPTSLSFSFHKTNNLPTCF